jgi:hypothetical protein
MLKRIAYALTGLVASALIAVGATIPLLPSTSQYSEPSQIVGTINALIQQLNGQAGYAAAGNGALGLGQFCTNGAAGASPQICNGQRGTVLFTGITVAATGTSQTLTITNSTINTSSICQAWWLTPFTAGSNVMPQTYTPTAGSLAILFANAGPTTNAVTTGTLAINCVN